MKICEVSPTRKTGHPQGPRRHDGSSICRSRPPPSGPLCPYLHFSTEDGVQTRGSGVFDGRGTDGDLVTFPPTGKGPVVRDTGGACTDYGVVVVPPTSGPSHRCERWSYQGRRGKGNLLLGCQESGDSIRPPGSPSTSSGSVPDTPSGTGKGGRPR